MLFSLKVTKLESSHDEVLVARNRWKCAEKSVNSHIVTKQSPWRQMTFVFDFSWSFIWASFFCDKLNFSLLNLSYFPWEYFEPSQLVSLQHFHHEKRYSKVKIILCEMRWKMFKVHFKTRLSFPLECLRQVSNNLIFPLMQLFEIERRQSERRKRIESVPRWKVIYHMSRCGRAHVEVEL